MVQKILFLTVPSNNILNMGFFYYCLFSIFMVTPSVIFLVWYPLRNKYTNFRSGQKWQSTLNIPSLKISVAKVSHTLYFQQKFYNTFPWITAVNQLKDISFSFCHYFRFFHPMPVRLWWFDLGRMPALNQRFSTTLSEKNRMKGSWVETRAGRDHLPVIITGKTDSTWGNQQNYGKSNQKRIMNSEIKS